jgi:hypothetical protein
VSTALLFLLKFLKNLYIFLHLILNLPKVQLWIWDRKGISDKMGKLTLENAVQRERGKPGPKYADELTYLPGNAIIFT